jgi:uncharacterized protein (TIGR03067 family)
MKTALNNQLVLASFALSLTTLLVAGQLAPPRPAIDQNRLQGYWEGEGAGGKCSITIKDNTLHYRAGTNWHQTTFTLPAGTNPQQLHATIKDSWPPAKDSIGTVVHAIIKLEDGTLTLALFDESHELLPKTFDELTTKYVVKKVQSKSENAKPPKTK